MKAFRDALLGLAVTAPAMAGPYVSTKSEFKGDEDGYSKTVHQARLGHGWKLDNGIGPYAELGGGLSAADGVAIFDVILSLLEKSVHQFLLLNLSLLRQSLSTKWGQDDARDWEI